MKRTLDPGINEVRRVRMALSARFDHDLRRLCAYLRREQKKHWARVVDQDGFRGARSLPAGGGLPTHGKHRNFLP